MKVYFIEGSDYVGKSTFIKVQKAKLEEKGKKVLTLKEPDGIIRELVLSKKNKFSTHSRAFLFTANHLDIMQQIYNARNDYDIILVDRCALVSDFVYTEKALIDEGNKKSALSLTKFFFRKFCSYIRMLDLNTYNCFFKNNSELVFLSISKSEFLKRINSRKINENDLLDSMDKDFKVSIYDGYKRCIDRLDTFGADSFVDLFSSVSVIDVTSGVYNKEVKW